MPASSSRSRSRSPRPEKERLCTPDTFHDWLKSTMWEWSPASFIQQQPVQQPAVCVISRVLPSLFFLFFPLIVTNPVIKSTDKLCFAPLCPADRELITPTSYTDAPTTHRRITLPIKPEKEGTGFLTAFQPHKRGVCPHRSPRLFLLFEPRCFNSKLFSSPFGIGNEPLILARIRNVWCSQKSIRRFPRASSSAGSPNDWEYLSV